MDWAKNIDPIQDYIFWLNKNYRQSWTWEFDDVIDSFGYFSNDATHLLQYARIWEDRDQDPKRRLKALNEFETYTTMGNIIENNHLYYKYVTQYSIDTGIPEEHVHEIAERVINERLHVDGFFQNHNR